VITKACLVYVQKQLQKTIFLIHQRGWAGYSPHCSKLSVVTRSWVSSGVVAQALKKSAELNALATTRSLFNFIPLPYLLISLMASY